MAPAFERFRAKRVKRAEPAAYVLLCAFLTLWVATRFYGSLRLQTLHALHWADPSAFSALSTRKQGPWSAPLDDVFIHFDFARSTARGFPFQWSEGNGYSSGGTSLSYPFVLALGYWMGFRDLRLMEWAAIVACIATFGLLLGARRLASGLPTWAAYLLPFVLLCVGALDWSLFSGMEVAWFLALWTCGYLAADDLRVFAATDTFRVALRRTLLLGLVGAALVATRPEAITAVGALAGFAGWYLRKLAPRKLLALSAMALAPAIVVLLAHAVANRVFTGESTAAGALVKLEAYHPYLTARQVFDEWLFHLKYQVLRVTQYHFADRPAYGWIAWVLAIAALASPRTRAAAILLWTTATLWVLIVAFNGQVRWQNERYAMPAVAWFLAAAGLGAGALLSVAWELRSRIRGAVLAAGTVAALALFAVHQAPRFREQLWFFGRASRNIFDQHVRVGALLRSALDPVPDRVLVGDAGAIPYVSDLPALDIIGLGGYRGLPFARATREHVGAAIELIERMAPGERPDVMALYPSWWGDFPLWFGHKLTEVPVRGNVICGGLSKVIYRPDWSPLSASAQPFSLRPGEQVVDELDEADLVNERQHRYHLEGAPGFVSMKLLASPKDRRPLWDAGRLIPPGAIETFRLSGLDPRKKLRLIVRAAPTEEVTLELGIDGQSAGHLTLTPSHGWVEGSLEHLRVQRSAVTVRLGPANRERIVHHVFVVREP